MACLAINKAEKKFLKIVITRLHINPIGIGLSERTYRTVFFQSQVRLNPNQSVTASGKTFIQSKSSKVWLLSALFYELAKCVSSSVILVECYS